MDTLWLFVGGFVGGLIRGLIGVAKEIRSSPTRKKKIRADYIIVTLLASAGIGLMVGMFVADDVRFAILAGYAGSDFLEGLFKIQMAKKSW